ncbi:MAG: acyl--CoA ligase [Xanthobacteraceae bacterium]|nr:acyl--CoA ligase [Xanthobacteraceae bacterium]
MDWSNMSLPAMRIEAHFGDRLIPVFEARPRSLWEMVEAAGRRNPDGEAIVCGEERLSWRETVRRAAAIAAGLESLGLRPGDRLAVLIGNRTEFVLTLYAAAQLGLIAVLLSTRLQRPEVAYMLTDCGAAAIVYETALADRLPDLAEVPDLRHRIVVEDRAGTPSLPQLAAHPPRAAAAAVAEDDTALIMYTSGTTGRPKGAMLSHGNIIHSSMIYEACMELTAADRSIAAVPLGHVTGTVANVTAMARCAGTLIIVAEFKAADYLRIAARERATQTIMVPAMYNLCLLQADFDNFDLSSWRIGGFGGAPMPVATIEKLAQKIPGLKLINAYGATETTSPSTIMPPALMAAHIDSVGLPCPGATIVAMDDEGREVPRGEVGELWIHGGSVIKGYWNKPEATAESFTGGFWHSGDLGSIDADGFVRVFDRKKDMINRGGHKIYSAEVESVLAGHDDVMESAIIAKPCPVLGERVHAVIVSRNPALDVAALRAWCAARLSDYKVPETVTVSRDPLPRNANGKVLKKQLREALLRELA